MINGSEKTKSLLKSAGADKHYVDKRSPVVELCEGCARTEEINGTKFCLKYQVPSFHWENEQICAFATHIERKRTDKKKKINPIKLSKRLKRK